MNTSLRPRPASGSALGRALLLVPAVFLLMGLPENVDSWDSPGASVIPSERTMPVWGNYVVAVVMVLAGVLLVAGWLQRRVSSEARSLPRAVLAWVAVAGLGAWAVALVVSQVLALLPEEGVIGQGVGIYLDGAFALAAVVTMAVLIRDALALRSDNPAERNLPTRASAGVNQPERS